MKLNTNKVRIAMARKAMNCPELTRATGLSINSISEYMSGKRNPTSKSVGRICIALGVDVMELIEA